MNSPTPPWTRRLGRVVVTLCLAALASAVQAHEGGEAIPYPGFRPQSTHASEFVESLDSAQIAVLPTIVRTIKHTAHSFASQEQIVAFLNENDLGTATAVRKQIDPGIVQHRPQWEIFQNAMQSIAAALEGQGSDADYTLAMEVILAPGNQAVFGIECYVLDRQGRNAFSFLLNSHHKVFVEANLIARDSSEAARTRLIAAATRVGVTALKAQVDQAREGAAQMAANPPQSVAAGVLHDFESTLPAGRDPHGIPLGFSTFTDGQSAASIATTESHPPRTGEAADNSALRLDLDVKGWAGFVYLVEDVPAQTWQAQDWSAFDSFSFWLHGNKSGLGLFVDVLDNRNPRSTVDDAERYVYEFTDDFSGWKQVTVRFRDMVRKEIGNGAPNDGLGLSRVHGWGFGATATGGPTTYFIDDFELRTAEAD